MGWAEPKGFFYDVYPSRGRPKRPLQISVATHTRLRAIGDACLQQLRLCTSGMDGWGCTREEGHSGPHIACGSQFVFALWPQSVGWMPQRLEELVVKEDPDKKFWDDLLGADHEAPF